MLKNLLILLIGTTLCVALESESFEKFAEKNSHNLPDYSNVIQIDEQTYQEHLSEGMWLFGLVRPDYEHRDMGLMSKLAREIDDLQVAFFDLSSHEDALPMKATFEIETAFAFYFIQDGLMFEILHEQFATKEKLYQAIRANKPEERLPLPELKTEGFVNWWQVQLMFGQKYAQFGRPLSSLIGGKTNRV